MMKKSTRDVLVVGFALFAIFFGAGNLIFPPTLGIVGGQEWWKSTLGFLVTDPLLPILGIIATIRVGGQADDLGKRISPKFSAFLAAVCMLAIGPFFSVPRTAATTHEIATIQIFPNMPVWVTTVLFFALTLWLALNPSRAMDRIGKILTPALLVALTILIVGSFLYPDSAMAVRKPQNFFLIGFREGYQTMDALGAALMSGIAITHLISCGYDSTKERNRMALRSGIVAFILLAYVYAGLSFMGARLSSHFAIGTDRTLVLLESVRLLFGKPGALILGAGVSLACLTTSVGLTVACGNYFDQLTKGKLPYQKVVIISTLFSFFVSLLGVEGIIKSAVPVLQMAYPVMIVLIVLTFFDRHIRSSWTYTGAVIGAFAVSALETIGSFFIGMSSLVDALKALPFGNVGMEWLLPAAALSLLCTIVARMGKKA